MGMGMGTGTMLCTWPARKLGSNQPHLQFAFDHGAQQRALRNTMRLLRLSVLIAAVAASDDADVAVVTVDPGASIVVRNGGVLHIGNEPVLPSPSPVMPPAMPPSAPPPPPPQRVTCGACAPVLRS